MNFIVGQRWASHAETHLGLGIVTESQDRRVTVIFPASEESRVYASDNAPLSRIKYSEGDIIQDMDEKTYTVVHVHETAEIFSYLCDDENGEEVEVHEIDLSCFVKFNTPQQRLFSGQIDKIKHFDLRTQTLNLQHKLQQSPIKGLQGSRTNLLPHQVYIAKEVAERHAPRVLLADEVGLGKTIEAGMILHHQIHTGQVSRVLILVPDSLVHQWLVEMLRRFNLHFSIYDAERFYASRSKEVLDDGLDDLFEEKLADQNANANPFENEQLILCPLSLLTEHDDIFEQALATDWDMLIVDEAHHLKWSEQDTNNTYGRVEQLTKVSQGVLLLTATPEQLGIESHFARLRLLDPARFHDIEAFKKEQKEYEGLNELVDGIHNKSLTKQQEEKLKSYLGDDYNKDSDAEATIAALLDRHGTGRVLFRNTRAAVKGFPQRIAKPYELDAGDYLQQNSEALSDDKDIKSKLYPEANADAWLDNDPRVDWLIEFLKAQKNDKILLICHHADTAIALDKHLNLRAGIRSASFYDGLSIIERDRAAAYFAEGSLEEELDSGLGAQVLICSEIGSEGRNFQFAHHLVLFDLPHNPDLLEQRIGRLDRIGQQHDIQIHIPYIANSAQETLFSIYHEGMQIFERSCACAYAVYSHFGKQINQALLKSQHSDKLISEIYDYTNEQLDALKHGRDRLLELNSCKPEVANELIDQIDEIEDSFELNNFMDTVFDQYAVETEHHSDDTLILRPSEHMQGAFPGLNTEDGTTVTFSREKALSREDMQFLSWEHPMVSECIEMILNEQKGNTAMAGMALKNLPKGMFLLECYYTINAVSPKSLQLERYLPLSPFRLVIGSDNKNYSQVLGTEKLAGLISKLPRNMCIQIAEQLRPTIIQLLEKADKAVLSQSKTLKETAQTSMQKHLGEELIRLQALQKHNPSVRQSEVDFIKNKIQACEKHISHADYQLQSIRVIINNY